MQTRTPATADDRSSGLAFLMIAAFARMARVRRDVGTAATSYLEAAKGAATFILERMWNAASRTLLHRYRDGHAGIRGYAEDYAYLIFGLIELFQADSDPAWLDWAVTLQRQQDELFWDEESGGWFSTDGRDPSVLVRMKEEYDGAEPASSSMSVLNLLWLSHLVEDRVWNERLERTLPAWKGAYSLVVLAADLRQDEVTLALPGEPCQHGFERVGCAPADRVVDPVQLLPEALDRGRVALRVAGRDELV